MGDKEEITPEVRNPKEGESPGKYFRAVEAWVEDAEKIDNLEEIPLFGHLKTQPASSKELSQYSKKQREIVRTPKDKDADQVNDNIVVNEMLVNIMEALKEDDKGGRRNIKKKVYAPLERGPKKIEEDLANVIVDPAFIRVPREHASREDQEKRKEDQEKKFNDLLIEDIGKASMNIRERPNDALKKDDDLNLLQTGGFLSTTSQRPNPFSNKFDLNEIKIDDDNFKNTGDMNLFKSAKGLESPADQSQGQKVNPFAKSLYPSDQISGHLIQDKEVQPVEEQDQERRMNNAAQQRTNRRLFEKSMQSTINDISAITGDALHRDNLDSRGSFIKGVHLFDGDQNKDIIQDKVLTPGIKIIGSPEKRDGNEDELDLNFPKSNKSKEARTKRDINNSKNSLDDEVDTQRGRTAEGRRRERGSTAEGRGSTADGRTRGRSERLDTATASRRRREKFDPANKDIQKDYNWIHDLREYNYDKAKDQASLQSLRDRARSKDSLDNGHSDDEDGNDKEPRRKLRRSQVLDLLTRLNAKKGDDEKRRTRGDSIDDAGTNKSMAKKSRRNLNDTQGDENDKNKINKTSENKKDSMFDPNGSKDLAEHFKWLQEKEQNIEKDNKVDDTDNSAARKEKEKENPDLTQLLKDVNVGTRSTLDKELDKDEKNEKLQDFLRQQIDEKFDNKSFPLSKKITGETDLKFEEDEDSPFFVNFKKRKYNEEESVLLSHHNNEEDSEIMNESFERVKSVKSLSRIEWEEIDEPISNSMIQLFVGMKKKVTRMEYLIQEVRKPDYTLDTFFERNFKFRDGKFQITKNFFFVFLILTGVMLYFIFDTLDAKSLSRVKNDSEKNLVAKLFIPAAIIFTYYGMGLLYMPIKWMKYIVAIQVVPCTVLLAVDLGRTFLDDKPFPDGRVYVCVYIIATNLFWVVTRFLRRDIKERHSWAWSLFFMLSWCILLPTATIAYAVYVTVVSRRFNYNWAHELTLHIGIPTMFLFCLTWVYYHFKFFVPAKKKPAQATQAAQATAQITPEKEEQNVQKPQETISKEAEERMRENFAEISEDEDEKENEPPKPLKLKIYMNIKSFLRRVSKAVILISSFSLGGSLIFIEGLLLTYVSTITSGTSVPSDAAFYFAIVLYFFIPLTVFFGIPVIANNKNHAAKMFWIPFIAILLPLFVTMPVSNFLIDDSDDTTPIGTFFALAPSIVIGFWITVSYIGHRRKKAKFSMISYLFICFVIPLVVLQPIINNDGFQAVAVAQGFSGFFIAVGIIILVIVLAYLISKALLMKEIAKKDRLNTDNYKLINIFHTDLEPFGYWANSLGFIVNFSICLYTLFHSPDDAPTSLRGMALGLSFTFITFFIFNNLGLHLNTISNPEISKYGIRSLSAAIIQSVRDNELYEEFQKLSAKNDKISGYTRLFTLFAAILSGILALAFSGTNVFVHHFFATFAVGVVLVQIMLEVYCGLKQKKSHLSKAIIPMLITYFWFVHALAFPSVLHLTRVFFSDDEEKKRRIQTQLIVLVFVITVSLIAIIANIVFKGIELEQKVKYILAYIRKQLERIAVKSDYFVLQRIFNGWMEHGEKKLRNMLVNRGKPAFWWPIPATNPNTKYSKVLLDFDAYSYMKLRLKNRLENKDGEGIKTKKRTKRRGWLAKLCGCLGFCFPFLSTRGRQGKLDEELNEEIEELLDLQMHEVPLPPKEDGEESDEESEDDEFDPSEFGDWEIESKIAENKMEITDVKFKPLDERVLRAMMYYDSGIKFAFHDKWTVDFLKFVYRLFAIGNYKYFKKRWLDYLGYKRFMILAAIIPTAEFPDYMVDLIYTLYTHNVGRGQIQRRVDYSNKKQQARKKKVKKNKKEVERDQKLKVKVFPIFEEDFEGFLTHIAKRRFPNEINDRDALFRLIRWHLFPNFLHLLPSVQKEYPHEYEYLKFLIDLYEKMDQAAKAGLNLDGTRIKGEGEGDGNSLDENNLDKDGKNNGSSLDENANKSSILNGLNLNGTNNSNLNGGENSTSRKGKNCCQKLTSCFCGFLSVVFKAFKKCASHFWKKFGEFFENFFFLKTNAQKKADKEFEEQQRKADKEEREEVRKIRADKEAQTQLGDDPDLQAEELNKQGQFRRKRRTYPHKPSPEWPAIVETIIKALKEAENDYEQKKLSQKQIYFIPSVRNICSLLAKIFEVYCLASIAFRVEVPWGWPSELQEALAFPSGFTTVYKMKIWSSLAYSIFYCYIGMISISFAKEGILGADKATMKAGEFPSRGFAHSQILTHFSTTLSVWIITTFLGLFACDYYATPDVLYYMPQIECDSARHHWFIVLASFGLLFYYPISSFLYPNLQYLNVGNDIKYDTSFVVLFNQAKLIIIAVTIFFPYKNEALVSLLVSVAIWIGLAVVNRILKPNMVKVLNLWETALYFTGAWVNIVGVIAYFSESAALATTILILGLIAIFLITFGIHHYKRLPLSFDEKMLKKKKTKTVTIESPKENEEKREEGTDRESQTPLAAVPRSMAFDNEEERNNSAE